MSTEAKVITRDGVYGLVMHSHGGSAVHPVNERHTALVGGAGDIATSHTDHAAGALSVLRTLPSADLRKAYAQALGGVAQEPWHGNWKAKLAARKAKRVKTEDVTRE